MSLQGNAKAKTFARRLRKNQTHAESVLWKLLRNRQFHGRKFLRQHPIFTDPTNHDVFYIADFYCHEASLVIELDGPIHEFQCAYDRKRTEVLNLMRLRVLRFKNEEVEENLPAVLEEIRLALTHPPWKAPPFSSRRDGGMGG